MKSFQITLILISFFSINEIGASTCSGFFESELTSSCEKLSPEDSYGCQYLDGQCISKKSKCLSEEATNEEQCTKIKPLNLLYKCSFINDQCTEVLKECSEYEEGKTNCMSLSSGDSSKKCALKGGKCEPADLICTEFTSGVYDSNFCYSLAVSNEYKIWIYSPEKRGCVERYKECSLYNKYTFEDDRNREECESIEYYDSLYKKFDTRYICVFDPDDNNSCSRKKRECSDIKDKNFCFKYELNKYNKRCVYVNGKCKEEYESCSDANYNECSSVTIFNSDNTVSASRKCVVDLDDHDCYEKNIWDDECVSYMSENVCIHSKANYYKRCFINDNNKCVQKYIKCPKYTSKEECNSIKLVQDNEVCIYDEENRECLQLKKECSEYKGTNEYICMNKYDSLDKDKKCFMENGRCVEKYIYCENYTDTNEAYCRAIIPHNGKGESLDSKYKCVMGENNRCERKRKECKDFNTVDECQFFEISLTKNCAFKNGQCVEQYKTCEEYFNSGEQIEENKCNSIILEDEISKCVFDSGKCIKKNKICSDFNLENYLTKCGELSKLFDDKKCVYSDSVCQDVNRTCWEITSSISDKTCENAKTSDPKTKRCIAKNNFYGCEEINKVIKDDDSSDYLGIVYNKFIYSLSLFILILFL